MDFEPISFDEYKKMNDEQKQGYIKKVADNFQEKIQLLMPIDGSDIFKFGRMQPPELVDLGLKSGTLWAATNIGASTPYEPGLYFAWGDINGYNKDDNHIFNIDNYIWYDSNGGYYTKYSKKDGILSLLTEDDAAVVNFGDGWHIPSVVEFDELIDNTTVNYNLNTNSIIFSNDKGEISFFMGGKIDKTMEGYEEVGMYWSNQLDKGNSELDTASCLKFGIKEGAPVIYRDKRCFGLNIRPTYKENDIK